MHAHVHKHTSTRTRILTYIYCFGFVAAKIHTGQTMKTLLDIVGGFNFKFRQESRMPVGWLNQCLVKLLMLTNVASR